MLLEMPVIMTLVEIIVCVEGRLPSVNGLIHILGLR